MRFMLFAAIVFGLAVLFGAYRDAQASSRAKADTIIGLSYRVASLEQRVRSDETTLIALNRKVGELCFRGHVVTDVAVGFNGSLSPSFTYC